MADGNNAMAAPRFGSNKPPKYDEEGGFDLYKAMLQSYLSQRECWGVLDGTVVLDPNAADAERQIFTEKNAVARDALLRGVLIKDATKICMLTSAREMWVAFEQEKTKRAFSNALYVRKKLYGYTFTHGMDMDMYLDEMEAMRRQLRNMNDEVSDNDMVKLILQGVAFEYRGLVRMFDKDVRDGNMPTLSEVLNTLRSEAEVDKQRSGMTKKPAKSPDSAKILQVNEQQQPFGGKGKRRWKQNNNKNKKGFKGKNGQADGETRTCFFCNQPGHLKRDCSEYLEAKRQKQTHKVTNSAGKSEGKKKSSSSMSLVRWSGAGGGKPSSIGMVVMGGSLGDDRKGQKVIATTFQGCDSAYDEWMIDSGAGVHVCTDWTAFSSLQEDSLTFIGWKGDTSKSEAYGQVTICTTDVVSGKEVTLELEDARYASGGVTNLLSLERLEQQGWVPSYSSATDPALRVMYLNRDGVQLELAKRDGHYWLRVQRRVPDSTDMCMVTSAQRQSSLMHWHMKFAHLHAQALKQMVLKDMAEGMKSLTLKDFDEPLNCIACTTAKQKRRSYKRHNKRSNVCFERLMSDVCYVGVETTGGNRYFQLVQDEASRYKWCYLLRHKSEAAQNVMNLILELEKEHNIKRFSCDQGKEFVNKRLKTFLAENGMKLLTTNAYTPEENSLVEKLNGNLLNKVRAIRESTGLPSSLWGEVLMYVVEVDNMSPTKALTGVTPYEKLTGTKPDVGNLRVCGCVAFAHVPKKLRHSKLSAKATPTLFLGYASTSLGYRLLDLKTGDLIERRDVSFREDITVDSTYVSKILARRYRGGHAELPDRIPYVHLPVNAVLDSVHVPENLSDSDDAGSAGSALGKGDIASGRKRRREDSSDSSGDDVDSSGSLVAADNADDSGSSAGNYSPDSYGYPSIFGGSSSGPSSASSSGANSAVASPSSGSSSASGTAAGSPSLASHTPSVARPTNHGRVLTRAPRIPTRRSSRVRRPPPRFDPSTWVMACTVMQCMLICVVSELLNPTTVRQALASEHAAEWKAAMDVEYNSLMKNVTWELVPRPKSTKKKRINILTSVWVLVVKRDEKGAIQRFKARLAVRGFLQKYGIDYLTTYSPVVRIESVRLVLIIALMQGLDCRHVDFVTAFLNGELADVDIYMEQPQGYHDGTDRVCHLLKGLYGLKQASKIWNDTLHAYLVELQFTQCVFDAGVYYRKGLHVMVYLTVYVDDIVIAAMTPDIDLVIQQLSTQFEVKDLGRAKHLLGMEINFQPGVILCLSQTAYVERMAARFGMELARTVRSPQMHNERVPSVEKDKNKINDESLPYREKVGSLQYVVACTRPDMANTVRCLGKYNGAYTRENFTMAKRAIRYLVGTNSLGLVYRPVDAMAILNGFADADHAMCADTSRSNTGFVLQLSGCAWMWKSKQQGRVTTNTCASELVAACDCVDNLVWARQLLKELLVDLDVSTVYCDNQSALQVIANRGNSKKVQRFAKEARMVAEFVDEGVVQLEYVSTAENLADIFTKALGPQRFEYLRDKLSLENVMTAWNNVQLQSEYQ